MGRSRFFNRYVYMLCRLILGCVFLYASYSKILHPEAFARAIYHYRMLPVELVSIMAIILPWLEAVTGVFLIAGVWIPGTSLITVFLNILFIIALFSALIRGLDIACGCYTLDDESSVVGLQRILEDVGLLVMGWYLFFYKKREAYNPD